MKKKIGLLDKIKSTWKDKTKRKHLFVVTIVVLMMAAIITMVRADKTTVNDIEIQHTALIVEEYETDDASDIETTASAEGTEATVQPEASETVAEETSEQIFFLEETTAPTQ